MNSMFRCGAGVPSAESSAMNEGRVSVPERRETQAGKAGTLPPAPAPVEAVADEAPELAAVELTATRFPQPASKATSKPRHTRLIRESYPSRASIAFETRRFEESSD